jgi:hypothetical protein
VDITRDINRGEMVEADITRLIVTRDEKRQQTEGERLEEELYESSARAWRERQEAEIREAWREYHRDQAVRHRATLEALATYHESEAAKLQRDGAVVDEEGG